MTTPPKELTHGCVRCGRQVPLDVSMCERCNPLGLEQPATTQVHGTVFVGIVVAVIVLAVAGRVALAGVGPFRPEIVRVVPAEAGLAITLSIENQGTKTGTTTCRLTLAGRGGVGATAVILSPRIQPGENRRFTTNTEKFGAEPVDLVVDCQGP